MHGLSADILNKGANCGSVFCDVDTFPLAVVVETTKFTSQEGTKCHERVSYLNWMCNSNPQVKGCVLHKELLHHPSEMLWLNVMFSEAKSSAMTGVSQLASSLVSTIHSCRLHLDL